MPLHRVVARVLRGRCARKIIPALSFPEREFNFYIRFYKSLPSSRWSYVTGRRNTRSAPRTDVLVCARLRSTLFYPLRGIRKDQVERLASKQVATFLENNHALLQVLGTLH